MKKIFAFLLSASMLLTLAACGGEGGGQTTDTDNIITQPVTEQTSDIKETTENADSDQTTDPTIKAPGKTLVVYFSGSGNTKRVAEIIAEESSADMMKIAIVGRRNVAMRKLKSKRADARATVLARIAEEQQSVHPAGRPPAPGK